MRRAGEVCFSDVFKDRRYGGKLVHLMILGVSVFLVRLHLWQS